MRPRPARDVPGLEVAVIARAKAWRFPGVAALCRRAAEAAVAAALRGGRGGWRKTFRARGGEIGILLAGDSYVAKLNALYRGRKGPTNVLSFSGEGAAGAPKGSPLALGDLVVAHGVAAREAKKAGKPLRHHLTHLVVHGVLHLLGYDHERDKDAARMEALETDILRGLGVPDPYGDAARDVA